MNMGDIQEVSSLKALNFLKKKKATNIFLKDNKIVFTECLLCQVLLSIIYMISFNSQYKEMPSLTDCLFLNRFLRSRLLVVSK